MEEMTFEEMESYYIEHSVSYERSRAFRKALSYIEKHDYEKYKEIITIGYNESFV